MELFDAVEKRYSCRRFSHTKVDRQVIAKCVDAARLSPSATNSQPWKFIIADDEAVLKSLAPHLSFNKFAENAPALIVMVKEKANLTSKLGNVLQGNDFSSIDIGIAAETLCLALTSEGVNSCILGMFSEKGIKKVLGIPKARKVPLVIAAGYQTEPPKKRAPRKPAEETVGYNKY